MTKLERDAEAGQNSEQTSIAGAPRSSDVRITSPMDSRLRGNDGMGAVGWKTGIGSYALVSHWERVRVRGVV